MPFLLNSTVARRSVASEVGVVVGGPFVRRGDTWYTVIFAGRRENVLEGDLCPVVADASIEELFAQGAFGDEKSFSRLLTLAKINEPVRDTIYSYQANRTDLHGYQYKPLLKYLSSPYRRILIADEVGLGKTIEAGYILQEERARQDLQHVLVVCPASLRVKWRNEMQQRFGEKFEILDAQGVRSRLVPRGRRPEDDRLYAIVSFETIRSRSLRARLDDDPPSLDFLIVDEVHHCRNRETHNFRIVRQLAEDSQSVVFLSATPVHTGNDNLFNLMNLLLPERFDVESAFFQQLRANRYVVRAESFVCKGTDEAIGMAAAELQQLAQDRTGAGLTRDPYYPIVLDALQCGSLHLDLPRLAETQEMLAGLNLLGDVLTRTRKRDVQEGSAIRSAQSLLPALSEYEQHVYDTLSAYIFSRYEQLYDSTVARFVLSGLQRQVASSLFASIQYYRECFATETTGGTEDVELEIEETDFEEDEEGDADGAYSLRTDSQFRKLVHSFSADRLRTEDTKYRALLELFKSKPGKVIVFAFFKRSLRYLEERLHQDGFRVVRIDGDVPSNPEVPEEDERVRRIQVFKDDPNCKAMLSSQVGSEGLDFQFCDTVVNWDLPWNPMVVEQRIGRIDRLGQAAEKIFIYSLVSKGTIEEMILERLYLRIGVFQDSIGDLEPILGPAIRELTHDLFNPRLTREEKESRVLRSALAIENERLQLNALEQHSAELIGHDEIIRQKIEKIRKLGRYLTGKELEIFVGQFLARQVPASELHDSAGRRAAAGEPGLRFLPVTSDLRTFVEHRINPRDVESQRLRQMLRRDRVKLAFESATAMAHPDAELIHAHHPLVRLIAQCYDQDGDLIHRVNALTVSSDAVQPGVYFYGWASIDERGAFSRRHLRAELLGWPALVPVADSEASERLIHEMVINGAAWNENRPNIPMEAAQGLFEWLDERMAEYTSAYRVKQNREATALTIRRLQALEASYRVRREWRDKAIATARAAGRAERMIRLQEDQIRRLEADFESRKAEVESKKTVDVSYRLEGVGWVQVVA